MEKVEIVGVDICNITLDEATEILREYLMTDRLKTVFTPNSEILVEAVKDMEFCDILNNGDLVIPDGIGVVIASKFYGQPLKERVTGFDLMLRLIQLANDAKKSIYFLGGKPGVAEKAKENLENLYKDIIITGVHDGYFDGECEEEIIKKINKSNTDILIVALGAPKQEKWICQNKDKLNVKIAMGVGGSIDVLSGNSKRAPEFYQKAGLEWFYRLMKEPKRLWRMMRLPKFVLLALYDSLTTSKNG